MQIGKVALVAFSVKKIVEWGAECIKLGSDLSEVQNVVDTAFPEMNKQVNQFAQNAITQFGLGQTVTKKYMGTFGAMAKSFNFSEKAAYEMSSTLTGLAGDVASFYNSSTDEAYTRLKSVFTGETETLKELGVVMTQNALDQYALANGYGKTTAKMTEQEKVALRYAFVQKQLQLASGDFIRTQDSWANQTRVLTLRFNEFKATLGQGFINIFTPIVQGINWVLAKLQTLANAFLAFTNFITGNKNKDSGMGTIGSELSDVTDNAGNASNAIDGIGNSAAGAAKKAKKAINAFDELNILDLSKEESSGAGSGGVSGSGNIDFGTGMQNAIKEADQSLNPFLDKLYEIAEVFKKGFGEGLNGANFDNIKKSLANIKETIINIFSSPEVSGAAKRWADAIALDFGRFAGSVSGIGITIAENLIGGVEKFLAQNEENLKQHLIKLFDLSTRSHELSGNIMVALADIFSVFKSDAAKQITADLLAIFTDSFARVTEIIWQFGNDAIDIISAPFINNKDLIKTTIEGMFEPISNILSTVKQVVQDTFSKFWEVYSTYIAPAIEKIKEGFSSILETFLVVWNENLKPIFDEWGAKFSILWAEHIQPFVNQVLEFIGKLINGWTELWKTWIQPFVEWIVENVVPVLAPIFETIGNVFMTVFGIITDVVGGILKALGGAIDFIVGIFTGNWEKAWGGIKDFFGGIWDAIKGIVTGVWNAICNIVDGAINVVSNIITSISNNIKNIFNGIRDFLVNIWNGITGTISNVINGIKNTISSVLNTISNIWNNIWNGLKTSVSNIFNGIWNAIKGVINSILGGIENMANGVISGINFMVRALNKLHFDIPDWIPLLGGKSFGFNIPELNKVSLPRLAQGGYFKANQPTPVIVGDNKTQAEIVSPEDKIRKIYREENQNNNSNNKLSGEITIIVKDEQRYTKGKNIIKLINGVFQQDGYVSLEV